jgi:hypothetical protein
MRAPLSSCSVSGAYVHTHRLWSFVVPTLCGMAEDVENLRCARQDRLSLGKTQHR